ncbi:hypothetical protein L7F22_068696 [Adiantum nelumboides]|nr:hypothetical protein [Adiantum nelumboides]
MSSGFFSEFVWKKSVAHPNEEESGLSASLVTYSKATKKSDTSKCAQNYSEFDYSASRQNADSSLSLIADGYVDEVTSAGLNSYQQMLSRVDMPLSISRQKSGSWRTRAFSELGDLPHPRSSRWSNIGTSINMFTDGEQEEFNEHYIRSIAMMHNNDPPSPQVESPKCGLCNKGISQKSIWSFSRALGSKELPVVGILECGHVYHADCLDHATPVTQACDPPCPKCEDHKRARIKVQEDLASKSRMRERSHVKGKISRVGVSTEDLNDAEPSKVVRYQCGLPEVYSRKGGLNAQNAEKGFSTKSLLRRQFSFRGKASREVSSNGFGSKRPGYAARVSPENSTREDYSFGKRVD